MAALCKLEFYVPEADAAAVKAAVFEAGAGRVGNYDSCCWQTSGRGQFRPLAGSNPALGVQGEVETVAEVKVELVCGRELLPAVVAALRAAHPYETPALQWWPVEG